MPIDGGLVVGYLTSYLLRGARHLADRAFEALLDRLAALIEERLGPRPLHSLERSPEDPEVQAYVRRNIEAATRTDAAFLEELGRLVGELDRRGGRQVINEVYARTNVQAFDRGIAVGRDLTYVNAPDPSDLSAAPAWVKTLIALGTAVAVAGLGIFLYTLFTGMPDIGDPDFGEVPSGIPLAFGVFFAGFIILGIGALGRAMSKRR